MALSTPASAPPNSASGAPVTTSAEPTASSGNSMARPRSGSLRSTPLRNTRNSPARPPRTCSSWPSATTPALSGARDDLHRFARAHVVERRAHVDGRELAHYARWRHGPRGRRVRGRRHGGDRARPRRVRRRTGCGARVARIRRRDRQRVRGRDQLEREQHGDHVPNPGVGRIGPRPSPPRCARGSRSPRPPSPCPGPRPTRGASEWCSRPRRCWGSAGR